MLSPKMPRSVRVNDSQLLMLSDKANKDHSVSGYLQKRTADSAKWQMRYFVLYQNLLFYYDNDSCVRPSGVILLEGCYCDRLITTKGKEPSEKQQCFAISYRTENQRRYELKTSSEADCKMWIDAIREASFNKMMQQKTELEQKHLHLLQIVESEKTAKWQYTQQCEELTSEIKKLRTELNALKRELRSNAGSVSNVHGSFVRGPFQRAMSQTVASMGSTSHMGFSPSSSATEYNVSSCFSNSPAQLSTFKEIAEGSAEMRKIKKVQSFFRGWLCRRRWKQIVEQYIKSPHAESMRKRNSLVFQMVEAEEEYTEQMEVLVSCFLRPLKMAASSKNPPCSHEDVNSIFLNSETVLFLHQIFLKGLTSRMESWPTLVLGDLFDMLLPMLSIYQEYVRNHHYSLQVLTECKQTPAFSNLLSRCEDKPICDGRSLEIFLTYPMHQVPRYIITLHELLAHTPHDHVERKSLQNARQQLEDLSRQMHDEVSETENLRKNLAVERMIVEGCDILLDVHQVFVRQGTLIQILDKPRGARSRLSATFGGKSGDKEIIRQCFLFSNHLILTTRQADDHGRLNLVPDLGKIPLSDAILVEDPSEQSAIDDDELSECSMSSGISETSAGPSGGLSVQIRNRDFKIIVDLKIAGESRKTTIHLVAPTMQEKAAWISDISQCMDNVHFHDLLHGSLSDTSSVIMPQSIRNDPKLFKDDVDIRFSRTLNSCKVPQIRYATPDRLLQRLTDLRFLSIDFLNTFLLTYRVFTDGETVLEALKKVFYDAEPPDAQMPTGSMASLDAAANNVGEINQFLDHRRSFSSIRRTSGASSVSGYGSEISENREHLELTQNANIASAKPHWRAGHKKLDDEQGLEQISETASSSSKIPTVRPPSAASISTETKSSSTNKKASIRLDRNAKSDDDGYHLTIPKVIAVSSSSETLTDTTVISAPSSPSNISSITLVGSAGSGSNSSNDRSPQETQEPRETSHCTRNLSEETEETAILQDDEEIQFPYDDHCPPSPSTRTLEETPLLNRQIRSKRTESDKDDSSVTDDEITPPSEPYQPLQFRYQRFERQSADHRASIVSAPPSSSSVKRSSNYWGRRSMQDTEMSTSSQTAGSHQNETGQHVRRAGVVVTSSRQSQRRSSTSTAAHAFAIATSASSNPRDKDSDNNRTGSCREKKRKESVMSTAATMRVLNVLRHWVSKHSQDFEMDDKLKKLTKSFLEDIISSPNLLPAEHKAANQLLRMITKEETDSHRVDLKKLLTPTTVPTTENIESLSALEIAEQITYLDHQIFISIASEEFLGQAWMKPDKAVRAPHITLMTKRFNEVSQLVVSEIIRRNSLQARVAVIEKWAAVADISRVLHNYNGVLQICAAFTNSSVYRLKKTWEKVSKTTKQTIDRLQTIVSSEHRFRNLRDALRRCDPPCIPYLGLYLSDLSFIEEGTPNFTDDGLLNFSKMRMVAHVIREIRHFQQTPYKIELIPKVKNYLLDRSLLLDEEELYRLSLEIEPRTSRLSSAALIGLPPNIGASLRRDNQDRKD